MTRVAWDEATAQVNYARNHGRSVQEILMDQQAGNRFDSDSGHPYINVRTLTQVKTVTKKLQYKLNSMRAAFPRALSIVLLAFIICGTTVEAAHNHGSLVGSNNVTSGAHFSDPATESQLGTTLPGCGDCLICQLHQNFSATAISVSPSLARPAVTASFVQSHSPLASSQTIVTRTGRAPPKTSC